MMPMLEEAKHCKALVMGTLYAVPCCKAPLIVAFVHAQTRFITDLSCRLAVRWVQ